MRASVHCVANTVQFIHGMHEIFTFYCPCIHGRANKWSQRNSADKYVQMNEYYGNGHGEPKQVNSKEKRRTTKTRPVCESNKHTNRI